MEAYPPGNEWGDPISSMKHRLGSIVLSLVATAFSARPATPGRVLDVLGVAAFRGVAADGRTSWLQGGFGRLGEGGDGTDVVPRGELHLGFDWKLSATWRVHAHGVAHGEPASYSGQRAGLTEAFVQFRPELTPATALRFRAGLFFPPTSLENTDPLWQSPYSITLSALNTWIGEEVRLTGVEGARSSSARAVGWRSREPCSSRTTRAARAAGLARLDAR